MKISRVWAMPNPKTFQIKPIADLLERYKVDGFRIDPFANDSEFANVTNDIDPQYNTDFHMDATDFLRIFKTGSIDMVLYDPPYSPRAVSECYKKFDKTVNWKTTSANYWGEQKREIARIVKRGGTVITCAWNSGGIGKTLGFDIVEILLVPHGGHHNDTIVTVERKVR